ncbi:hypothetical protein Dimus_014140, partial [Dionaea muscipula]
ATMELDLRVQTNSAKRWRKEKRRGKMKEEMMYLKMESQRQEHHRRVAQTKEYHWAPPGTVRLAQGGLDQRRQEESEGREVEKQTVG